MLSKFSHTSQLSTAPLPPSNLTHTLFHSHYSKFKTPATVTFSNPTTSTKKTSRTSTQKWPNSKNKSLPLKSHPPNLILQNFVLWELSQWRLQIYSNIPCLCLSVYRMRRQKRSNKSLCWMELTKNWTCQGWGKISKIKPTSFLQYTQVLSRLNKRSKRNKNNWELNRFHNIFQKLP